MTDGIPTLDIEETLLKADGSKTHILTSKVPLRDAAGAVNGILGIYSDVTGRRAAEDRFRTVFQSAGTGMALIDVDCRIVTSNRALQSMLGYGEELSGLPFGEITHAADREMSAALYRELLTGSRESYQLEKRYVGKDGRRHLGERFRVAIEERDDGRPGRSLAGSGCDRAQTRGGSADGVGTIRALDGRRANRAHRDP